MSTATRVSLAQAQIVADQVLEGLRAGCEQIAIAGSVRRQSPTVGDIEIVAIPRVHTERLADGLFEDREVEVNELQITIDLLLMDGTLTGHPTDAKRGPLYSKVVHTDSQMQVDIFSVRPDTWGMGLMVRTGPASYSQWLVTEARARHFHVAHGFELHPGSMSCGSIPCVPIPTPDEDAVFTALHLHPTPPESRR